MITLRPQISPDVRAQQHYLRALTTTELIITMAIFSIVILGAIELHIFGLRQNEIVESKLGASDQARMAFARMVEDIQSAKLWEIGEGSESGFTPIPNGMLQQGTALQLYPTNSSDVFIRYFFDPGERELRRTQSGLNTSRLVAAHLTNNVFFTAEDYQGNIKSNLTYKCVIGAKFEFYQYDYPTTKVGEGNFYDYYKLEFKVTPHCPDGA